MVNHQTVYQLAVKHGADVTPSTQIFWEPSGISTGKWRLSLQYNPSVLDCVVLEYRPHVQRYQDAVLQATGWTIDTYFGFQQMMLQGRLIESAEMERKSFAYWKGVINGLLFIEMYKTYHDRRGK